MPNRWLAPCCALVSILLLSACVESEPPAPPPLRIPVADVIQRDQEVHIEMVGETRGSADIPIRARVEGIVLGTHFQEGGRVEEGQLLYTIDPVPYESKVVEADGYVAEAVTALAKAKADLDRIRPLAEMGAVSQVDLDGASSQHEAALGALQTARARKEQAEIQLSYTRVTSPINGRIGITKATVGEFVGRSPNPVVLNFVSLTDPIRVRFAIDERSYLQLARRIREQRDSGEGELSNGGLELILADGTVHPHTGRATAADAAVDPETGTFTLEADFPNPEGLVLAGQFARVRAVAETREGALLVPQRAISELQGLYRVFVVDAEGTVELRPVELGPKIDRLRVVEKGVNPGERVAVEIARLRPELKVEAQPVQLAADGSVVEPEEPAAPDVADEGPKS